MPQLCRGKLDLSTLQKRSCLGKLVFHRWKVSFPPLEPKSSAVGTEKFPYWNWRVPPLELKSSKRGTVFGTRK